MTGIFNSEDLCAMQSSKLVDQPGQRGAWREQGKQRMSLLRQEWLDALVTSGGTVLLTFNSSE